MWNETTVTPSPDRSLVFVHNNELVSGYFYHHFYDMCGERYQTSEISRWCYSGDILNAELIPISLLQEVRNECQKLGKAADSIVDGSRWWEIKTKWMAMGSMLSFAAISISIEDKLKGHNCE